MDEQPVAFATRQAVAEELREELEVRGLAAAGARARELEERLEHLRALDGRGLHERAVDLGDGEEVLPPLALGVDVVGLRQRVERLVLRLRLVLRRAGLDADPAAGAVVRRDLDRHEHPRQILRAPLLRLEAGGCACERGGLVDLHADRRVRADERALGAVDADRLVPDRELVGEVAPLEVRRAGREGAVDRERADGQEVAAAGDELADEVGGAVGEVDVAVLRGDGAVDVHLVQGVEGEVDGVEVALHDLFAALRVRRRDRLLDRADRALRRQHAGEREEARLEDRVHAAGEAGLTRDLARVDDVQPQLLREDVLLHVARQPVPDVVRAVRRVQEDRRSVGRDREDVHAPEEVELVARDELRALDEIRRPDRPGAEAEVRDGRRAGLLRVDDEVALGEERGRGADDLGGVLVRADGPVGAEAVEDAAYDVVRLRLEGGIDREARVGDVVVDADGEVAARLRGVELGVDGGGHARCELLRAEAVTAADEELGEVALLGEGGDDVLVERLADGSRSLLRSRTARARVVAGSAAANAAPSNGR